MAPFLLRVDPIHGCSDDANPTTQLLTAFAAIAREVLGDRARPLNDRDRENADDLLDAFSLDEVLPLLGHYFACDADVLREQAHSFTYFAAYVHVVAGAAQDVTHDLSSDGMTAALISTVGAIKSPPQQTTPTSATTDPQMQEVLNMMMGRLKKAEPLQDSVLAMANGLLPTQYQNGGGG